MSVKIDPHNTSRKVLGGVAAACIYLHLHSVKSGASLSPNLWSCMFCAIKWRVQAYAGIKYKCDSVRWLVMNISKRVTTARTLDTQVYV